MRELVIVSISFSLETAENSDDNINDRSSSITGSEIFGGRRDHVKFSNDEKNLIHKNLP